MVGAVLIRNFNASCVALVLATALQLNSATNPTNQIKLIPISKSKAPVSSSWMNVSFCLFFKTSLRAKHFT